MANRKQLKKLREMGDAMTFRAQELTARDAAQQRSAKFVSAAKETIAGWPTSKPWINETERGSMLKEVGCWPS